MVLSEMSETEHVIGGKFRLGRKIGSGSFGELYLGMLFLFKVFEFSFDSSEKYGVLGSVDAGVNVQSGEEVAIKLVCKILELGI